MLTNPSCPKKPKRNEIKAQKTRKIGIESPKGHEHRQLQFNFIYISDSFITISYVHAPNTVKRYGELRKTIPMSHRTERPSCIEFCLPLILFKPHIFQPHIFIVQIYVYLNLNISISFMSISLVFSPNTLFLFGICLVPQGSWNPWECGQLLKMIIRTWCC